MKNIGLIVYGRFPTEKAYGSHLIDTANGFLQNGLNVHIFYSQTSNKKTINENPETYYQNNKIRFMKIQNYDFTKLIIYRLLPGVLQKALWTIGAYYWSGKLTSKIKNVDTLWSTNPNLLIKHASSGKTIIYEKHGAGKFVQKYVVKKLSVFKNVFFVGTSKTSYKELSSLNQKNTIYLTNGVNLNDYVTNNTGIKDSKLNIGYIGMLETYGKDKGVKSAFKELKNLAEKYDLRLTLIGGPEEKIDEIVNEFSNTSIELIHKYKIPKNQIPRHMQELDIGIVPYPNEYHMSNYASPLKIFEYAAANTVVLSSDIKSNLELDETGLGIMYFKAGDFNDFRDKVVQLITNSDLRNSLIEKSKNNIVNYSLNQRMKKLIEFCVRSSIG